MHPGNSFLVARLAAVIRGDRSAWDELAAAPPDAVCDLAEDHGVLPLIWERAVPGSNRIALHHALQQRARRHAAADLIREEEVRTLIAAFAAAGVKALLMKGSHLAYSHYPRPDLRPRADTDLLIAVSARADVELVLRQLEYAAVPQISGDLVMYQAPYLKRRVNVPVHRLDLHWRIANPQTYGQALTYEELLQQGTNVPALGPAAVGLSDVHALLLACIHRVVHHFDSPMLIWHYDVHLLASSLTDEGWNQFVRLANERGVGTICRSSLERSGQWFDTNIATSVHGRLSSGSRTEAAAALYLSPGRRHIREILWDFRSLASWSERWRLARQHLFPPPRYMREVYAPASGAPLAVLYARRAWRGARKWLTKS